MSQITNKKLLETWNTLKPPLPVDDVHNILSAPLQRIMDSCASPKQGLWFYGSGAYPLCLSEHLVFIHPSRATHSAKGTLPKTNMNPEHGTLKDCKPSGFQDPVFSGVPSAAKASDTPGAAAWLLVAVSSTWPICCWLASHVAKMACCTDHGNLHVWGL